jgi:hypothetical protein
VCPALIETLGVKSMAIDGTGVRTEGRSSVLGLCWIVFGIFRLIVAVWMLSFAGTATVMFGTLLNRVPNPYSLMSAFHIIYSGWLVLSAASGIFGILAGITLLTGSGVSRMLALVARVKAGRQNAAVGKASRRQSTHIELHGNRLLAIGYQVPTGRIAPVRKQGMNAHKSLLGINGVELVSCFSTLLGNGIKPGRGEGLQRIGWLRMNHTHPEISVVTGK